MTGAALLLAFVTVQRLAELAWARRNETRLRAAGAVETGAAHYPLIVALHAAWLACCWLTGWNAPVQPLWLALFVVLQLCRVWVLATLGPRWTTRVFSLPGETLVRRGPYRFVRHPNYLVVALEIPVLPLALGRPDVAVAFGLANVALLAWRIRVEDRAIRPQT